MTDTAQSNAQDLIPLLVSRVVEDSNTDTRIIVLTRTDDADTFTIWVGAPEGEWGLSVQRNVPFKPGAAP